MENELTAVEAKRQKKGQVKEKVDEPVTDDIAFTYNEIPTDTKIPEFLTNKYERPKKRKKIDVETQSISPKQNNEEESEAEVLTYMLQVAISCGVFSFAGAYLGVKLAGKF